MPRKNVDLLREALRGEGGAETFYSLLDPRVEWDVSRAPGGDVAIVNGRDAVRAFLPNWRHGWEYWRFEEEDFIDGGDRIVTIARGAAGRAGEGPERTDRAALWTFRGGKVVRFVWYERAPEALADAGMTRG